MFNEKEFRRSGIERIFKNNGMTIVNFIEENGVITEGQFGLMSEHFKMDSEFIEKMLIELKLPFLRNEDAEYYNEAILTRGFHNGSKTYGNYFYFVYYNGHHNAETRAEAEMTAVEVYNNLY